MGTFLATKETVRPKWHLIDAEGGPLGRLGAKAAGSIRGLSTAQALSRISVVNALVVMIAKVFMGALAQGFGLQWAFLFPITMYFIAGLVSGVVANHSKRQAREDATAYPPTGPISSIDA